MFVVGCIQIGIYILTVSGWCTLECKMTLKLRQSAMGRYKQNNKLNLGPNLGRQ